MNISKEEAKFLYGLMDAVFHFAHVASVEHVEALTHNIPKLVCTRLWLCLIS